MGSSIFFNLGLLESIWGNASGGEGRREARFNGLGGFGLFDLIFGSEF